MTTHKVDISDVKLSEVYDTAVKFVKDKRPELVEKLTKNIGFGMGIEFREAALLITNKTNVRAKKGELWGVVAAIQSPRLENFFHAQLS